jgi:hypothetical protein
VGWVEFRTHTMTADDGSENNIGGTFKSLN